MRQIQGDRPRGLFRKDIGYGGLKPGTEIPAILFMQATLIGDTVISGPQDGSLQPGEGQIAAGTVQQGTRQGKPVPVPAPRLGLDRRAAGLRKTEHLRNLVERLARCIVDRAAQTMKRLGSVHDQELTMAARDKQKKIGKGQTVGQPGCQGMTGKMVDAHQGQASGSRQALCKHDPGHHPADQTRSRRHGNPVQIVEVQAGGTHGAGDAIVQFLDMGAGGDFRDNTPECRVKRDLSFHDAGQDFGMLAGTDDRGRGVITARFDAKKGQRGPHALPLRQGFSAGNTRTMVPQSHGIPVLITRPEPQASRFAARLTELFGARVTPILTPLLHPVDCDASRPDGRLGALILTSEAGARAAGQRRSIWRLPKTAYCVGGRTAEVAASFGFETISADGDAADLLDLVLAHATDAPFLHLRGRDTRGDLVSHLRKFGVPAAEAVVYAQMPCPLTEAARQILGGTAPVAVPLFSPRSASLFRMAAATGRRAPLLLFALSAAVATEVKGLEDALLWIADHPTQQEMEMGMSRVLFGA